jgi:hypothetical protein
MWMHYLLSQSVFFAAVTIYDAEGNLDHQLPSYQVGYSLLPALITLASILAAAIILCAIGGVRTFDSGIPLVGTNSAAISAACHKLPEDREPHIKPVMWGVVKAANTAGPGHCCLTSLDATAPVEGSEYAGLKEE